jgi:hypothetical protein
VKIKEQKMKLQINDEIIWVSAAGTLVGNIKNIVLSENAAGKTIPWIDIDDVHNIHTGKHHSNCRLCASHEGLMQLKIELYDVEAVY